MSNRSSYNKRAIEESLTPQMIRMLNPPVVPIVHTPPDRPFITKKDVRHIGGHRTVKKQGKGTAANTLYHPLIKPRLSERKTYRQLELMVNPAPTYTRLGPFKVYS